MATRYGQCLLKDRFIMFQTLFKSVTKQAVILYLYIEFHQVSLGYIAKNPLEVLETGRIKKMQSLHSG